jgi:uncharacterized protein YlxW (UPF0749 family)
MTLLTEVMERPLDPGYAAAAAARAERAGQNPQAERRGRRRGTLVTALVAVIIGALATTAVLQLRLPPTTDVKALLQAEIEQRTEAADATAARVEELRQAVAQAQTQALTEGDPAVLDVVRRLNLDAGAVATTGRGIVVTLDDASDAQNPVGGDPRAPEGDAERVRPIDVQILANGLWAAGAEAIAINGQRLTSLSAIRGAGDAILVGFRPLAPPYRIEAIGDPNELRTRLADSAAGSYLAFLQQNVGLRVSVSDADELTLPGAGPLRLRYAKPATGAGDGTGTDTSTEVAP